MNPTSTDVPVTEAIGTMAVLDMPSARTSSVEANPAFPHGPNAELLTARILIVDDEEPNVRLLERILTRARFENLRSTNRLARSRSHFCRIPA